MEDFDWAGKLEKRFIWWKLKFEWGRWHYNTDACGQTLS